METGEATPNSAFATLAGQKYNSSPFGNISGSGFASALTLNSVPSFGQYNSYSTIPKIASKPLIAMFLDSVPDTVLINVCPDLLVEKYSNMHFLMSSIYKNPKILSILESHGLDVNIKREHVTKIINSHLIPTMIYARKIMEYSGERFSIKASEVLLKAALLHDIGKVLIPSEIINKKGALTPAERKIIDLHSELGAEILKYSNIEPEVITLVANHHRHLNNEKKPDRLTHILTIADIYSALREKRAYKDKMENCEIFEIFHDSINNGELERRYFVAIKEYAIGKKVSRELEQARQEILV